MRQLTTHQLEARLIESLQKDRSRPSRCTTVIDKEGTTVTVTVSNKSLGLAIAVCQRTTEQDPMDVIRRLVD